jgi:hypothetical protein
VALQVTDVGAAGAPAVVFALVVLHQAVYLLQVMTF